MGAEGDGDRVLDADVLGGAEFDILSCVADIIGVTEGDEDALFDGDNKTEAAAEGVGLEIAGLTVQL